jgi:hypothetical protein
VGTDLAPEVRLILGNLLVHRRAERAPAVGRPPGRVTGPAAVYGAHSPACAAASVARHVGRFGRDRPGGEPAWPPTEKFRWA